MSTMTATTVWRDTGGRILGGWGPLLCVLVGALVALVLPRVGVEDECCAKLKGIAQLRCQVWGRSQRHTVQSTSLTVPFTALDLLPYRSKPSKGKITRTRLNYSISNYITCLIPYFKVLADLQHCAILLFLVLGHNRNIITGNFPINN